MKLNLKLKVQLSQNSSVFENMMKVTGYICQDSFSKTCVKNLRNTSSSPYLYRYLCFLNLNARFLKPNGYQLNSLKNSHSKFRKPLIRFFSDNPRLVILKNSQITANHDALIEKVETKTNQTLFISTSKPSQKRSASYSHWSSHASSKEGNRNMS